MNQVSKMPPNGPRRSSQLKIDIEGLPEGKSQVNVMCFDLGGYSIGQKKSAMAKKVSGFSAIFSSGLQCCFYFLSS